MKTRKYSGRVRLAAAFCLICLTGALGACGDNAVSSYLTRDMWTGAATAPRLTGEFAGAGASSQKSAVDAWIVVFSGAQPQTKISYDPSGSGAGVNTFLTGAAAWAGTDAPLNDSQIASSKTVCQGKTAFDLPVYVSPIAVAYNLSDYGLNGGKTHLKLKPRTVAKIFSGAITRWNDPEIASQNPSLASRLPALDITPIWRSDKSGTTKVFQDYLHAAAGKDWPYRPSETWPNEVGQGAKGTSGVVLTSSQAQGTIGYADAAQVSGLGTVALGVGEAYVPFSAQATVRLIARSPRNKKASQAGRYVIDVDYATKDPRSYPLALVSYDVACPAYKNPAQGEFVKQWLTYEVSSQGQRTAAANAGAVELPETLRAQLLTSIDSISGLSRITPAADERTTTGGWEGRS